MKLQLEMLESSDAVEELKADVQEMETTVGEFLAFVGGEGREDVVSVDLGENDPVSGEDRTAIPTANRNHGGS